LIVNPKVISNLGVVDRFFEFLGFNRDPKKIEKKYFEKANYLTGSSVVYLPNKYFRYALKLNQEKRFELAKLSAETFVFSTIDNIKKYHFDEKYLIEIAKMVAMKEGGYLARHIKNFGIKDRDALIEILNLAIKHPGYIRSEELSVSKNIKNFPHMNASELKNVALKLAKHDSYFSAYLEEFNFKDEPFLIELANVVVMFNGSIFFDYYQKFNIKNKEALFLLFRKACHSLSKPLGAFIENDGIVITKQHFFEITKKMAATNRNSIFYEVKELGITDKKELEQIARAAARNSDQDISEHIDKLKLEDRKALIEIAKVAAANDKWFPRYVKNYGIKDKKVLFELAQIGIRNDFRQVFDNIDGFELTQGEEYKLALEIFRDKSNEISHIYEILHKWRIPDLKYNLPLMAALIANHFESINSIVKYFAFNLDSAADEMKKDSEFSALFLSLFKKYKVTVENSLIYSPVDNPEEEFLRKKFLLIILSLFFIFFVSHKFPRKKASVMSLMQYLPALDAISNNLIREKALKYFTSRIVFENKKVFDYIETFSDEGVIFKNRIPKAFYPFLFFWGGQTSLIWWNKNIFYDQDISQNKILVQQTLLSLLALHNAKKTETAESVLISFQNFYEKSKFLWPDLSSSERIKRILFFINLNFYIGNSFFESFNVDNVTKSLGKFFGFNIDFEKFYLSFGSWRSLNELIYYFGEYKLHGNESGLKLFRTYLKKIYEGEYKKWRYDPKYNSQLALIKKTKLFKSWQKDHSYEIGFEETNSTRASYADFKEQLINEIKQNHLPFKLLSFDSQLILEKIKSNQAEIEKNKSILKNAAESSLIKDKSGYYKNIQLYSFENKYLEFLLISPEDYRKGFYDTTHFDNESGKEKNLIGELQKLLKLMKEKFSDETRLSVAIVDQLINNLKGSSRGLGNGYQYLMTDSLEEMVMSGVEVEGSCQSIYYHDFHLSEYLLGFFINGHVKMILVKAPDGKIVCRAVSRLMFDQDKNPILHIERPYFSAGMSSAVGSEAILEIAFRRAFDLGIQLKLSSYDSELIEKLSKKYYQVKLTNEKVFNHGSRSPIEYVDSGEGRAGEKYSL